MVAAGNSGIQTTAVFFPLTSGTVQASVVAGCLHPSLGLLSAIVVLPVGVPPLSGTAKCNCSTASGTCSGFGCTCFPRGLDGKESACNVGDLGSIPGLRRSTGEGNIYPLQYSYLENSMDRGAWQTPVHGVAKNWTRLRNSHFHLWGCCLWLWLSPIYGTHVSRLQVCRVRGSLQQ